MKTEPNDPIQSTTLRQIGENDFRLASEKDIQQGVYLSHRNGLTKREYFASMALQGILSNPVHNDNNIMGVNGSNSHGYIASSLAASNAVFYADALIAQLNESTGKEEGR